MLSMSTLFTIRKVSIAVFSFCPDVFISAPTHLLLHLHTLLCVHPYSLCMHVIVHSQYTHAMVCSLSFCSVISCVKAWMQLSMSAQDARVSHCDLTILQHHVQQLCELTNCDYSCYLSHSKSTLASNIGDTLHCSLQGMLGELTTCTQKYCLPFV